MTILTYNSKYVVQSTTQVSVTSDIYTDDTPASQTFTLTATQTVLVIYNAISIPVLTATAHYLKSKINVDTVDYSEAWNRHGSDIGNYTRNTVFWIGTLAAGSHTIKGRLASESISDTVTIGNRILLIYVFNGNEFQFVDDNTLASTASVYPTYIDDPNASVTFTPSGSCKALYLYGNSNEGATEALHGKTISISVSGTDYSRADKGLSSVDRPESLTTCYANSLTAVSTTVIGRYCANAVGTVTINHRQLGVLLLADTTLLDIITSDVQVSSVADAITDDTQASITRVLSDTRELLVIAMGTKLETVASSAFGECYGIMTNAVDRQQSRLSIGTYSDRGTCNMTCWAEILSVGSQSVKGRYSNNNVGDTAVIDHRRVIALWLVPLAPTLIPVGWLKA